MSAPDPADVLVARAADRVAVIAMRKDAAAALEFCEQLHEHREHVRVALRCDNNAPDTRPPARMQAKFPGRCWVCATGIRVGEDIYYDAEHRTAAHARCV